MTENDLAAPSPVDLEAENARLRALLAEAGIDAASGAERPSAAATRPRPACAETKDARRDPIHRGAELRARRAASARNDGRMSLAFAAAGSLGWWDWDIADERLYAGEHFARMFGIDPSAAAAGAPVGTYLAAIHPEDRDRVAGRIERAIAEAGELSEEYRLLAPDGTVTWVHARGCCFHDSAGRPDRYAGVAVDITGRKTADLRKDALVELGATLRDLDDAERITHAAAEVIGSALHAARVGYGTVDPGRETVLIAPDWRAPGVASVAGPHRFRDYGSFIDDLNRGEMVGIADVSADPRTRASADALLGLGVRALLNVPILARGRIAALVFVHHRRPHEWYPEEIRFVRAVADRIEAAIARVRAEEQQRVLNRELSHRLKNTLALVQAIAAQTLRNTRDPEAARDALSLRLIALGKAHDILIASGQESAEVSEVVRGALALHADAPGRFHLDGPHLRIGPSSALSLTLILHELATNAAKYGALATEAGRIGVTWTVDEPEAGESFRLIWTETGGPPVEPPSRKGFGTRLIERGLSGGTVRAAYPPEGVTCALTTPLAGFRVEG